MTAAQVTLPKLNAGAIKDYASAILAASARGRSIPTFTGDGAFGLVDAYAVAAEVRLLREARGERIVGRKIGFTNTTIWTDYNVAAPIWGYVYDTTLHQLGEVAGPITLSSFVEPRIEPEVVFRLAQAPEPGMDETALLACIEWVALGFEIVQSLFPGWRFGAPDTVAAFGLHGALFVGEPVAVRPGDTKGWANSLRRFDVQLRRDGALVEVGHASNVLHGGPLSALRHLLAALDSDRSGPPLDAGEVITTGTLTNAYPITAGSQWSTIVSGLPIANIELAF